MSDLVPLFNPKSIAVIGASTQANRAGNIVMRNLLSAGFNGPILPVSPKYPAVEGVLAYKSIQSLPLAPDLAILCLNKASCVDAIKELGIKGVKLAIILASGSADPSQSKKITADIIAEAKKHQLRIIGPHSIGMILPWLNINASFCPTPAHKGNIAFISHSAAACTTILDWAKAKNIGFSTFISLGETSDISMAELLDHLCRDSKTEAILLYLDSVKDARHFMSAARSAARSRRILVLKSGKSIESQLILERHDQNQQGWDCVYDAAIRRSGMLRVHNTHELFAAVETLAYSVPLKGERIAIVTNGAGPAIMAVDTLISKSGKLAELSESTSTALNAIIPNSNTIYNPIDLQGDADITRYKQAIEILLNSKDFDTLLIIHSPSAFAPSLDTAQALVKTITTHPNYRHHNILTNWGGESDAFEARRCLTKAGFPTYRTAESAVTAFMHLVDYKRNQKQLMETPSSLMNNQACALTARKQLKDLLKLGYTQLNSEQLSAHFDLYKLNYLSSYKVHSPEESAAKAKEIGFPVALKLNTQSIEHKSEIDGVVLHLNSEKEVLRQARIMLDTSLSIKNAHAIKIDGLMIQPMLNRSGSQELRVSVIKDPTFGPMIFLGNDKAHWDHRLDATAGFPPLNMALAHYMLSDAIKAGKLHQPSLPNKLNFNALSSFLVTISQMIIDNPEIHQLDIHPVIVTNDQLTIVDASMEIELYDEEAHTRLAIRPYPKELEEYVELSDQRKILLRPIRPEDEPMQAKFMADVDADDLYKRFFSDIGEVTHETLASLTQIDFDREMAFIAIDKDSIIGVSRIYISPGNKDAEFAVLIRSDQKGLGLGKILMTKIINFCQQREIKAITGITMPNNRGMIVLAQKLGFEIDVQMEDGIVDMRLPL